MDFSIDSISFGNPTHRQITTLNQKTYLDELFVVFKGETPPRNSSDMTKHELNTIVENVTDIKEPDNQAYLKRYSLIDKNLVHYLSSALRPTHQNISELYNEVASDVDPIILKLKFNFQRPRPKTLAFYYKMKLVSLEEPKQETPAYPSRTVVLGSLICRIVGNREPKLYDRSKMVIDDIMSSRTYIGSNYGTDVDFADKLTKEIIKNPNFAKKYAI
jgi:hypothetical protein